MEAYLLYATVGQAFGKHAVYIMDTILKAEPADRCMLTFLYRHSDAHDINIYRSVGQKNLHKIILLYFTLLYFTLLYFTAPVSTEHVRRQSKFCCPAAGALSSISN